MTSEDTRNAITNTLVGTLGSALGYQNDFVMKEVLEMMKTFTCGKRVRDILPNISKGVMKVLFIIILKHYITDPAKLLGIFKKTGWCVLASVLYKRESYTNTTASSFEGNMARAITDTFSPEEDYVRCLPVYTTIEGPVVTIQYAKGVHSSLIERMKDSATQASSSSVTTSYFKWSSRHNRYDRIHPSRLYPSKNYRKFEEMVTKNIRVSKKTKSYPVIAYKLDGCPGLGKSKLSEFLASYDCAMEQHRIAKVYRIDMSELACMKIAPNKLIEDAILSINVGEDSPTVIFVDEMDKHLAEGTKMMYTEMRKTKKPDDTVQDFESYSLEMRTHFLLSIQAVIEKVGNMSCCVVVFCTNNFDTIFGGVDMTHFDSLRDRFNPISFEKCDKAEIIGYIQYHNDLMRDEEGLYEEDIESLFYLIPDDISITYRSLDHLMKRCSHSPERVIREILIGSPITPTRSSSLPTLTTICLPTSSSMPPQPSSYEYEEETCQECRHHIDDCECVCDECGKHACDCPCQECDKRVCECEKCPNCDNNNSGCYCGTCWKCQQSNSNWGCECDKKCKRCDKYITEEGRFEQGDCGCPQCEVCKSVVCEKKVCKRCATSFMSCQSLGIHKYKRLEYSALELDDLPDICNECFKMTSARCIFPLPGKIPRFVCKECKHFTILRCECEVCKTSPIQERGRHNFLVKCHVCLSKDAGTYIEEDVMLDTAELHHACSIIKPTLDGGKVKDADGTWTSYLKMFQILGEPHIMRPFKVNSPSNTKFKRTMSRRIKGDMKRSGPGTTSEVISMNIHLFNDILINYYVPLIEDVASSSS